MSGEAPGIEAQPNRNRLFDLKRNAARAAAMHKATVMVTVIGTIICHAGVDSELELMGCCIGSVLV